MAAVQKVPFNFESQTKIGVSRRKVNISPSDLALGGSGKVYPLKKIWSASLGVRVEKVVPGKQGRFFVVPRSESVVLGVNSDGKVDGEFRCTDPYSAGEGKANVYVASKYRELSAYDKSGHKMWEREWPNSSYGYSSGYSSSTSPSNPVEDAQGNVWLRDYKMAFRFSPDGQTRDEARIDGWSSEKSIVVDKKGNAYTTNGDFVRIGPDMSKKTIDGTSDEIFLAHDLPFVIQDSKLYKLNFDASPPNDKTEILHWNSDKRALKPAVDRFGNIHLILRNNDGKSALYVVIAPLGIPLANGQTKFVKSRKQLDFKTDDVSPVVTPGGTLYLTSQSYDNRQWNYAIEAIDRNGYRHSTPLGEEEPAGLCNGKGEQVIAVFKDGSLLAAEAKSAREILDETKKEEMNEDTLKHLGQGWN